MGTKSVEAPSETRQKRFARFSVIPKGFSKRENLLNRPEKSSESTQTRESLLMEAQAEQEVVLDKATEGTIVLQRDQPVVLILRWQVSGAKRLRNTVNLITTNLILVPMDMIHSRAKLMLEPQLSPRKRTKIRKSLRRKRVKRIRKRRTAIAIVIRTSQVMTRIAATLLTIRAKMKNKRKNNLKSNSLPRNLPSQMQRPLLPSSLRLRLCSRPPNRQVSRQVPKGIYSICWTVILQVRLLQILTNHLASVSSNNLNNQAPSSSRQATHSA
jgi:hypothetical protein